MENDKQTRNVKVAFLFCLKQINFYVETALWQFINKLISIILIYGLVILIISNCYKHSCWVDLLTAAVGKQHLADC